MGAHEGKELARNFRADVLDAEEHAALSTGVTPLVGNHFKPGATLFGKESQRCRTRLSVRESKSYGKHFAPGL